MKSTEFLESKNEAKYWAELIKKNCKPFLSESKGLPIFRGMRVKDPFIEIKTRLSDRRPLDMPMELHTKLNNYFNKEFGEKFRNGLFVSGGTHVARRYGYIYQIYPIGNFKYIWSPRTGDLYNAWCNYEPSIYNDTSPEKEKALYKRAYTNFYHNKIKDEFENDKLPSAINSMNEIMIWCKSYYAIKKDSAITVSKLIYEK